MSSDSDIRRAFRARLARPGAILMPGAFDALAARVVADQGYEAIYLSGAGLTNAMLGIPDLGFISLPEIATACAQMRAVTDLPLVVDVDTGFGNALNVVHTVRTMERAGATAIQIEDQVSPKRCGHFAGKEVVALDEARARIRAAADTRSDMLIMARTDAAAVEGMEAALDRARAFVEDGADIIFVEAPQTREQLAAIPAAMPGVPQLVNIVVGGRTPVLDLAEFEAMGFSLVLYANTALQGAMAGMQAALGRLRRDGRMDEDARGEGPLVAPFAERQRLVGKPEHDALERRYAVPAPKR